VKSWGAFARGASPWAIEKRDGKYRIIRYRWEPNNWVQDPEQTVEFPPGTTLDQVIDRMIAILQEAARTYPEVDQGCSQSVSPAGYES
jgi:hypothetical protein